jgi:hypothetical protein
MEGTQENQEIEEETLNFGTELPIEGSQTDIPDDTQEQGEVPLMTSALDELGLSEDYRQFYEFDDDVDIDSPDGIKEVISRTLEVGADMFFNKDIKADPELYAFYLHRKQGGDIDSFIKDESSLPSLESLKNNVDLQSQVYRLSLREAGRDADEIELLLNNAIKTEKLEQRTFDIIEKKEAERTTRISQREQDVQQEEQTRVTVTKQVSDVIADLIINNEFSSIIRLNTDNKKNEFYNSLQQNLVYDKGIVSYNVPLTNANLKDIMEKHYLLVNPNANQKYLENKALVKTVGRRLGMKKEVIEEVKPVNIEEKVSASNYVYK